MRQINNPAKRPDRRGGEGAAVHDLADRGRNLAANPAAPQRTASSLGMVADAGALFGTFPVPPVTVRRGHDLQREGQPVEHVHLLCDGIVSRYRVLPDGRRQLLAFGVPGDVVGFPCCALLCAALTACCLTAATVVSVPVELFASALRADATLAAHLAWRGARDALVLGERLVAVGRRRADERIAYLVLELRGLLGEADDFEFPLTQELMADATGLSTPHVNRVLAELRARNLLAISGRRIAILDRRRLARLACFDPALLALRSPAGTAR